MWSLLLCFRSLQDCTDICIAMEEGNGRQMEHATENENRVEDGVIEDLENEKLEILNANASTATLNMQNFGNSEFHHRDEIVITGSGGDGTFESKIL